MKLDEVLAYQDGVISIAQARRCGLSDDTVLRKVQSGEWLRQAKGVYQSAQHRRSHVSRFRVAMLSIGTSAVAHGLSAAWWHGLTENAPSRHFITIPAKRSIRRTGVNLRRRDLQSIDVTDVRKVRVTGIALTALECGDSVLMDQALQTRTTIAKLEAAYARNRNCTGAERAGELLRIAASGGRSDAERRAHRILRPVPGWRAQLEVGGRALDIGFEKLKIGIEVDGWRWHKDSRRNSLDLKRQNDITLTGWTILRYDWHRLHNDPDGVLVEVTQAMSMRRVA